MIDVRTQPRDDMARGRALHAACDGRSRSSVCFGASNVVDGAAASRAASIASDLLHDDEVVILWIRPSPLYIVLGAIGRLAFVTIITMLLAYLPRRITLLPWSDANAFTFGTGLAVLVLSWQALEWLSRVYVLTDRRIIRRMGVLRTAVFETPLSRIQHTSVFRRVRERIFNLGTIGFATAGSDTYEAFWVMIARPYAVHKTVVEAINRYGRRNGA